MIRCEDCGERFGGWFGVVRHRPLTWDHCRTPEEMREIGLHRTRRRVWVRRRPTWQTQLDFRRGSRVRRWFGKSYRALSHQERQEYRRRLADRAEADSPPTSVLGDPRNAHPYREGAA